MRSPLVSLLLVGLCLLAGCSSFRSSSSPSRWSSESLKASSSPSRWSSESSGGADAPAKEEVKADEFADLNRYERDLADTTVSIVTSGGRPDDVSKAIYPVAFDYGITDYSSDPGTYRAIGKGLGKARLSVDDFERYRDHLARGSDVRRQLLLEGYASTR